MVIAVFYWEIAMIPLEAHLRIKTLWQPLTRDFRLQYQLSSWSKARAYNLCLPLCILTLVWSNISYMVILFIGTCINHLGIQTFRSVCLYMQKGGVTHDFSASCYFCILFSYPCLFCNNLSQMDPMNNIKTRKLAAYSALIRFWLHLN